MSHPIVKAWAAGKIDAGGCIAELERALVEKEAYAEECRAVLYRIRQWDVLNPPTDDNSDARFWRSQIDAVLKPENEIGQRPRASELIEPLSAEASEAWEGLMATADAVTPPALSREYAVVHGFDPIAVLDEWHTKNKATGDDPTFWRGYHYAREALVAAQRIPSQVSKQEPTT